MIYRKGELPRMGTAFAPAACGELVEGVIGDQAFLVSCPINLYSRAKVCLYPKGTCTKPVESEDAWPKARQAVDAALNAWQKDVWEAILEIESSIPQGKGMASSTADIGAALAATALALGRVPDPVEITQLAVGIEPTDSTLFPQLTIFDHVEGSVHNTIGKPPPLQVMVFDWGGQIKSDDWYSSDSPWLALLKQQSPLAVQALELLRDGVRLGDGHVFAQGATLSALLHQSILYKPHLSDVARYARERGALGVTIAHSGTVAGLVFPPIYRSTIAKVAEAISREFSMIEYLGTYDIIGGGICW
jgi:L-threonine kinase